MERQTSWLKFDLSDIEVSVYGKRFSEAPSILMHRKYIVKYQFTLQVPKDNRHDEMVQVQN
jgi:hypothetical protein